MLSVINAARRHRDERLLETAIELTDKLSHRTDSESLMAALIPLLADYDDERIPGILMNLLHLRGRAHFALVHSLVKQIGKQVMPLLVDVVAGSPHEEARLGAIMALASLVRNNSNWPELGGYVSKPCGFSNAPESAERSKH